MDCWVSVLRLFKYWHFELVPTQITSTRQPGDGTQQSAFLHSVASKVVRFAIVCRFQAIAVSVWLCSFHRKNVFAGRNVTISVLKRLEWFGQLSYLLMYAVQYVWKWRHLIYFLLKVFHRSRYFSRESFRVQSFEPLTQFSIISLGFVGLPLILKFIFTRKNTLGPSAGMKTQIVRQSVLACVSYHYWDNWRF